MCSHCDALEKAARSPHVRPVASDMVPRDFDSPAMRQALKLHELKIKAITDEVNRRIKRILDASITSTVK